MEETVARVAGVRGGVHRLADDPKLTGSCHVDDAWRGPELTADEFAEIASEDPRRLCGHCYPVSDR